MDLKLNNYNHRLTSYWLGQCSKMESEIQFAVSVGTKDKQINLHADEGRDIDDLIRTLEIVLEACKAVRKDKKGNLNVKPFNPLN